MSTWANVPLWRLVWHFAPQLERPSKAEPQPCRGNAPGATELDVTAGTLRRACVRQAAHSFDLSLTEHLACSAARHPLIPHPHAHASACRLPCAHADGHVGRRHQLGGPLRAWRVPQEVSSQSPRSSAAPGFGWTPLETEGALFIRQSRLCCLWLGCSCSRASLWAQAACMPCAPTGGKQSSDRPRVKSAECVACVRW